MKHQRHCPAVDLQPLAFQKEKDDGREAVFRALVNESAQGAVYALTLTVASPGEDQEAGAELEAFLHKMRAGFVLTAQNPRKDRSDDDKPEPFDIRKQILIEPALVSSRIPQGTFGVTFVVQTTAQGITMAEGCAAPVAATLRALARFGSGRTGPQAARQVLPGQLLRGKQHRYRAITNSRAMATASAGQGSGRIRRPRRRGKRFYPGQDRSVTARTVIVRARSNILYYAITGNFIP